MNAIGYTTPNDPRFREVEETINFQLRFPSASWQTACRATARASIAFAASRRRAGSN